MTRLVVVARGISVQRNRRRSGRFRGTSDDPARRGGAEPGVEISASGSDNVSGAQFS
jgi:hypothetical protein